jgi:pSer/pThr/pTyr-binding forkhead associated (FHA) protein
MQVTFKHVTGSKAGQTEMLDGERITVGRNPSNTVAFDPMVDSNVSGDHAQLMVGQDGRLELTDLNSTNGTFVDGQKIGGSVPINPGQIVQFGKDGPEVCIEYTPAAPKGGKTRMMLAQVQHELEDQKAKAAAGRKKSIIVVVALLFVMIIGGIITAVTVKKSALKKDAAAAQESAEKQRGRAEKANALAYAPKEWASAEQELMKASALLEQGEYEQATALFKDAADRYEDAKDKVEEGRIALIQRKAREESQRLLAEAEARREAEKRELEQKMTAAEERLRNASEVDRARYEAELEALRKRKTESEKARLVVEKATPAVCFIYAESYFSPKGTDVRSKIASSEGTGFFYGSGLVVTSKHVLQPYKYKPSARAKAEKIREEYSVGIKTYVEVHVLKNGKFVKAFDTAAGTASINAISPDKWETKEQKVTIQWNEVDTDVAVKLHVPLAGDLAILKVQGSTPAGLSESASGQALSPAVAVGALRSGDGESISTSPLRGDLQEASATNLRVSGSMPENFAGGPLLDLDGKLIGVMIQGESASTVCLPARAIEELQRGGSAR